jgi:hypothetical protein
MFAVACVMHTVMVGSYELSVCTSCAGMHFKLVNIGLY